MKKITISSLVAILLLSSCGTEELIEKKEDKTDFYIETVKYSDLPNVAYLEKTGKLDSTQDITLSSQATGRVSEINVRQGDNVLKGQILAILDDNIANYGLNLEIAKNNLEKAKINYDSTKIKLEKSIADIERELKNTQIDDIDSSSSLELEKIENSINKLSLDYENLKISNLEQISAFKNSLSKDLDSLNTYLEDVIDFSDALLGVTYENKDKNDDIEDYLGVKDNTHLRKTEGLLLELIEYKNNDLKLVDYSFEGTSDFSINIEKVNAAYKLSNSLLTELKEVLDNSITSIGSLSNADISSYKSVISGYETAYSSYYGVFISLKNSINSFLETYRNSEDSLLKQIELLEQDKKIYIKSLDIKLDVTESSLEEAKLNMNLSLKNLEVLITDAEIGYKQAQIAYDKLFLRSPINGIVGEILIDEGQEINTGTQAFSLLNESSNELTISFNKNELEYINEGDNVFYTNDEKTYTGTIYSIANNADSNLKFVSKVRFNEVVENIGNILTIQIPIELENKLISLSSIKINNSGVGTINYLSGTIIEQKDVKVGNNYGNKVEILDNLEDDIEIINSFVDNFDSEKFILKIK